MKVTQTKYVTEESTKNGKKQKKKSRTVTKQDETPLVYASDVEGHTDFICWMMDRDFLR